MATRSRRLRIPYTSLPSNSVLFSWFSFLILRCLTIVHSQTLDLDICVQRDDCSCKFSNGSIVDIAPVGSKSGQPRFDYAPSTDGHPDLLYAANICYGFNDHECKNQVICQVNNSTIPAQYFPLGNSNQAIWESDGNGITYIETYKGVTRTSHLALECDITGDINNPTFIRQGIRNSTFLEYDFTLRSICACPDGCGQISSGGLGFGSILCITFAVSVVSYLVVGMLFMKFARGKNGIEVIPHLLFWISLPIYIKDGAMWVVGFIRPGNTNYMTM